MPGAARRTRYYNNRLTSAPLIRELKYYARMALQMPTWARIPLEPDPHAAVRRALATREANFLLLARRGIFENPANHYQRLFDWAGCEFGDLERMVRQDGLEAALQKLLEAGVYLTHDEYKGMKPVERGSLQFMADFTTMLNPSVRAVFEATSSGSRSKPTRVRSSFENQTYREAQDRVLLAEYESGGREVVSMGNILPGTEGIRRVVDYGRRKTPPKKWFAVAGSFWSNPHYQLLTNLLVLELRLAGLPAPFAEFLPHNDFSPVVRWLSQRKSLGKSSVVIGGVSHGVRVAATAQDLGLDISGTTFILGGEALTDAKRSVVEAAGCAAHARYTITELGRVGIGCGNMIGNCVHFCRDSLAVISRLRTAPLSDVEVSSLLFTSLLPNAPNVVVNLEMDDAGIIGPARCGCPLSEMGFTQQVDRIYSYGKLTGSGTTLLAGDLLNLLERKLPARFGGLPGDYQLVEREASRQTEIELRVHPRLRASLSENDVKDYFLGEIEGLWAGSMTRVMWVQMGSVRVLFAEPYVSGTRGKIHLLHLLRSFEAKPD